MLVLLALLLLLLFVLYVYLTWHFGYFVKREIPGPKPKPLLGTFPGRITRKRNFIYDLDDVYCQFKNKFRFVGVFVTRNPQILILDPALAKEVLITNFKCFQDNESSKWMNRELEPISGTNPFVLPAAEWKIKRSEIVPGLTKPKVKCMYPIITSVCQKLIKYLKDELKSGRKMFDAKDFSMRFTGELVADVVWGVEAGAFNHPSTQPDCTFISNSKRMIEQTFFAFTCFFIVGIFPFLRKLFSVRFYPADTDHYFLQLANVSSGARLAQAAGRPDFLQHLVELKQRKGLSATEVVAHMLTFHFDGFETSATVISHCLLLLGRHPVAQQKLRREIMENLVDGADGQAAIPFDELLKLPYLEQCVAETLRIFAPLPFMSKICTESCELENGDGARLQVREGDICLISLHSFHHDEDFYPEAERFMPERFSVENGGTKNYKDQGVYLPFGDGPRICLGMKFALAQVKAAIVEVIKNFEVTINERTRQDNLQGSFGFIVGLEGGIYLNFKPIELRVIRGNCENHEWN